MKNYLKQMCRTPLQLLLTIALIMIVTVMLTVGGNLWVTSDKLSEASKNVAWRATVTAGGRSKKWKN